jgi:hypothetical protein
VYKALYQPNFKASAIASFPGIFPMDYPEYPDDGKLIEALYLRNFASDTSE